MFSDTASHNGGRPSVIPRRPIGPGLGYSADAATGVPGPMTDVVAGRYALIDPIGSGGSGTVWRAYDRRRAAYCAAKLLRQRDAGELLRFVREQSVRLDHPHIVSPYSWAAEDGTVLIASDLVAGGSLHTLIGDYGPLAEGTVVALLRQVLAGLAAVHDAELIHRDVKPANVLLRVTETGPLHAVLTDFGLTISRQDARLTQVGMVIGTPGYLPPEVLVGGVPPDPRHDLYAVGRLAVTLLGGGEPVGPAVDVIDSIRDPILRQTVDALLRRDPAERPPDVPAAAALLAGARSDRHPHTRGGDPVEVLDQLPALAAGAGQSEPPAPVIGPVTVKSHSSSKPQAPGQLQSHYAPAKPFYLGNIDFLIREKNLLNPGILSFRNDHYNYPNSLVLSRTGDLHEAARNLFGMLRELDLRDVDAVVAEEVPNHGLGRAINDRLRRAAAPKR